MTASKQKPIKRSARTARSKQPAAIAAHSAKIRPSKPGSQAQSVPAQSAKGSCSKQEAVLGMLRQVVKRKLRLNLLSEKVDGQRVYRIGSTRAL